MMIETNEGKILTAISSAQISRNLGFTCLIQKANRLPYCKRNILLTMLSFWDKVYTEVVEILVSNIGNIHKDWDVNDECVKYLKSKNLSNPLFCEFFFNFHAPITMAFLKHISRELSNGMPYLKKFDFIASELLELLNLAYIELEGLNISCETFGGEPMCPSFLMSGVSECRDVDNVFFVMMNEEYQIEEGLFEEILEVALDHLSRAKDRIIMIVDYKNLEGTAYEFGKRSRIRYNMCKQVVEQVYFYHCDGHMVFASGNDDLSKYIIPDKKSLDSVIKNWKENQRLLTF